MLHKHCLCMQSGSHTKMNITRIWFVNLNWKVMHKMSQNTQSIKNIDSTATGNNVKIKTTKIQK